MGTFVEFGNDFWATVMSIAGFTFTNRNLCKQVGVTSGVTPFRAFHVGNQFVAIVEPIHYMGAIVYKFDSKEAYNAWYTDHMHIDITNLNM